MSNPTLLAARRQLRATDETVPQALSGWRPRISITGSVGGSLVQDSLDPQHNPERRGPQDLRLEARQPLYNGGETAARVARSEAEVHQERATLSSTEQRVLLAAGMAYLDTLRDRDARELDRGNVALLDHTMHAAQRQLVAGAITEADLSQTEARLANAVGALATADARVAASEASFTAEIGQPPQRLAPVTIAALLPTKRDQAIDQALATSFEVEAANRGLEANRQSIEIARAALRPRFGVQGYLARARETDVQRDQQSDNIAELLLMLSVPIYQGGEEYATIRQAKETALRAVQEVERAKREARRRATVAWDALEASRVRVAAEERAIRANEHALLGITEQQAVGARTVLDVLNAQLELLTSRVALVTARHDLLLGQLQLLAALGRLTAGDLHLPVPVFDQTSHYRAVRDKWIGTTPPDDAAPAAPVLTGAAPAFPAPATPARTRR